MITKRKIVDIIIFVVWMTLTFLVLVCFGCGGARSWALIDWQSRGVTEPNNDGNCPPAGLAEFEGPPAETVADRLSTAWASNVRNAEGREDALFDTLKKGAIPLLLLFVGGLIFWGITRSKWGWVIPAAAVGGLGLITVFVQAARYIVWGGVGVAFLVVVWKAYEYQQERNFELDKNKKP